MSLYYAVKHPKTRTHLFPILENAPPIPFPKRRLALILVLALQKPRSLLLQTPPQRCLSQLRALLGISIRLNSLNSRQNPLLLSINTRICIYTRPTLPGNDICLIRSPPNHACKVMMRETLGVVRMLLAVVADQIVRQLVAQGDPPVRHGFHQAFRLIHAAAVQLLEEAQVAEDAAVLVESDCTALLVCENVESRDGKVEDLRAVCEQAAEGLQRGVVVAEEGLGVGRVAGEVDSHAAVELADEFEVVAYAGVAVRGRFLDLVRLRAGEE